MRATMITQSRPARNLADPCTSYPIPIRRDASGHSMASVTATPPSSKVISPSSNAPKEWRANPELSGNACSRFFLVWFDGVLAMGRRQVRYRGGKEEGNGAAVSLQRPHSANTLASVHSPHAYARCCPTSHLFLPLLLSPFTPGSPNLSHSHTFTPPPPPHSLPPLRPQPSPLSLLPCTN